MPSSDDHQRPKRRIGGSELSPVLRLLYKPAIRVRQESVRRSAKCPSWHLADLGVDAAVDQSRYLRSVPCKKPRGSNSCGAMSGRVVQLVCNLVANFSRHTSALGSVPCRSQSPALGWGHTSGKIDRDYVALFGARRRGERRSLAYSRKGRVVEGHLSARPSDKYIPKRTAGTDGERDRDATVRSDRSGLVAGEGPIHAGRVSRIWHPGRCSSGQRSRWRLNQQRLAAGSRCGFASCRFLLMRQRCLN